MELEADVLPAAQGAASSTLLGKGRLRWGSVGRGCRVDVSFPCRAEFRGKGCTPEKLFGERRIRKLRVQSGTQMPP